MLACAKLLLVLVLVFSPVFECFDKWEEPWHEKPSSDLVLTVLSCAIALGYGSVQRMIRLIRALAPPAPSFVVPRLAVALRRRQAHFHVDSTSGISPPLRI